jgi:hypothetical protein
MHFFIPVSYGRVTIFDRLPAECVSHIRLRPGTEADADSVVFDVTIASPDGMVVVDIAEFTMMRVREGQKVAPPPTTVGSGAEGGIQFEGAIEPEEGLEVFRRAVGLSSMGQIIVSPQNLEAYLAALHEPPEPPPTSRVEVDLIDATEVELRLVEHEAIEQAVVLAHEGESGEVKATAFVLWELGEEVTIAEIKRFLEGAVPEALIPEQIIEMEDFPRTADGSVDRAALPDPYAPKDDYVAPSTETERSIATIWMELLGVGRVSVHDNFLDVGGHSLLAMRAISKMAKVVGVRLNPSVMTLNTLGQIAAECDTMAGAA